MFASAHRAKACRVAADTGKGCNSILRVYLDLVDSKGHHDVYAMVVDGFKNPVVSLFYILAQAILFVHLRHGIGSVFQTLGLNTPRSQPFVSKLALGTAGLILLGNLAIIIAVWFNLVPTHHAPKTLLG